MKRKEARSYGYNVIVTVKKVKGECPLGHQVGDKIIFELLRVKGKICFEALATLMPTIYAFAWGVEYPWDRNKDITTVPCPDTTNQVLFELKRDKKHPWYIKKESKVCLAENDL